MTDWKAIAQAHNDSLVARIEENERLTHQRDLAAEELTREMTKVEALRAEVERSHSAILSLTGENERLREALETAKEFMSDDAQEGWREALEVIANSEEGWAGDRARAALQSTKE
jgi:hypothetical protein